MEPFTSIRHSRVRRRVLSRWLSTEFDSHGRPMIHGVRLAVQPEQAKIVQRIFSMYGEGRSLKFITRQLNAEGVQSPQPQKGRISRSWCPSSVRTILLNERYRGFVVWGRKKKVRSPKTGKRIYRSRPESEWVRTEIPEQRIISDELWQRAVQRREIVSRVYFDEKKRSGLSRSKSINSPYLFSGLLKCAECGANITILWGKGRNKKSASYGCPMNFNRGETVCKNTIRIRKDVLEKALLAGLQAQVLRKDVIEYVLVQFETQLGKALNSVDDEFESLRARKAVLQSKVSNLVTGLASGIYSPAVMAEIAGLETEISAISDKLLSPGSNLVRPNMEKLKRAAVEQMKDVRAILGSDVPLVRGKLLHHVTKIVLRREGAVYIAEGDWDLFGGEATLGWCRGTASHDACTPSAYPWRSDRMANTEDSRLDRQPGIAEAHAPYRMLGRDGSTGNH